MSKSKNTEKHHGITIKIDEKINDKKNGMTSQVHRLELN